MIYIYSKYIPSMLEDHEMNVPGWFTAALCHILEIWKSQQIPCWHHHHLAAGPPDAALPLPKQAWIENNLPMLGVFHALGFFSYHKMKSTSFEEKHVLINDNFPTWFWFFKSITWVEFQKKHRRSTNHNNHWLKVNCKNVGENQVLRFLRKHINFWA